MTDAARQAFQVGYLYDWALDRGAYGYQLDFELAPKDADLYALATSLLQVERERRAREWAALERLLAYVPPGGTFEEIQHLPRPDLDAALRAAYLCGFLSDPPDEP